MSSGPRAVPVHVTARSKGAALAAVAGVVCAFGWIETRQADQPFDGPHEDNGAAFMGAARNHLRYGLARTLGHDLLEPGTGWYGDRTAERRYLHHPPALALTLAGAIALFGDSPATGRLSAAALQLVALAAVLYAAWRFFSPWAAPLAGALFTLTPLGAYYGRSVGYPVFTTALMAWSQILFVEHRISGRRATRAAAIALACVSGLYDWSGFCWMAVAIAYELAFPPPGRQRFANAAPWVIAAGATFALIIGHIAWAAGGLSDLITAAANRMGRPNDSGEAASIGPLSWLSRLWRNAVRSLTGPLLFGVLGLAAARAIRRLRGRVATYQDADRLVALSAGAGLLYLFIFPSGSYYHEEWFLPVLPAACWAVALAATRLPRFRVPAAVAMVLCVWWSAGPWVELWFRACFAPYRALGACERPVGFTGFGRIHRQ